MKFELNIHPSTEVKDGIMNALVTKSDLMISREEIISSKEENEIVYYQTLREMIYMYHYPHGYVTQMTDDTMYEIYQYMVSEEQVKGVVFQIVHKEILEDTEGMNRRAGTVELVTLFV